MTPVEMSVWVEHFISSLAQKSEHTQKAYTRDLQQFIRYLLTQLEKPATLQKRVEHFFSTLTHSGVTPSSIARKISCLSSFKKFLKKQGIVLPIELKRPVVILKDPLSLPIKDIFNVLDLVGIGDLPTQSPQRDKALLELMYSTGITCCEIVTIEINCIDFTARSIIIRSKRKKERVVPFGAQAAVCIRAYLESERLPVKNINETLFLNHRGHPLTSRSVQRICTLFRGVLEKKRVVTPQVLRSSYAAHLINHGADIEVVQELLGHKTRVSTERYKKVRT